MAHRRSHIRYVRLFDDEETARPLMADGLPCARCGFPMIDIQTLDTAGPDPWRHSDCDAPPSLDSVAAHLVVHEARERGLVPAEWWDEKDPAELDREVNRYLAMWRRAHGLRVGIGSRTPSKSRRAYKPTAAPHQARPQQEQAKQAARVRDAVVDNGPTRQEILQVVDLFLGEPGVTENQPLCLRLRCSGQSALIVAEALAGHAHTYIDHDQTPPILHLTIGGQSRSAAWAAMNDLGAFWAKRRP